MGGGRGDINSNGGCDDNVGNGSGGVSSGKSGCSGFGGDGGSEGRARRPLETYHHPYANGKIERKRQQFSVT